MPKRPVITVFSVMQPVKMRKNLLEFTEMM